MVSKVITKRSTVAGTIPLGTDLEVGELAINTADKRLFSKHDDGTVFRVFETEEANLNNRMDAVEATLAYNTYTPFVASSGTYFDQSNRSTAASTLSGAANQFTLYPFIPRRTVTIGQIGLSVSTGVAGALAKVVIFTSTTDGKPADKWWEGSNLSCATATYVSGSTSLSFNTGTLYWLGIHTSSTAAFRSIPLSSAINLGLASNTGTTYNVGIRRTITWGNPIPNSWVFSNSEYVANITPISFRMRVA